MCVCVCVCVISLDTQRLWWRLTMNAPLYFRHSHYTSSAELIHGSCQNTRGLRFTAHSLGDHRRLVPLILTHLIIRPLRTAENQHSHGKVIIAIFVYLRTASERETKRVADRNDSVVHLPGHFCAFNLFKLFIYLTFQNKKKQTNVWLSDHAQD